MHRNYPMKAKESYTRLHCDFRKGLVAFYSQGENLPRQVSDMAVYSNTKAEPHMFQVSIRIH